MHRPGRFDRDISAVGFGAWGISGAWGEMDEKEYISAIHGAVDSGINFFDTAPVYGLGVSEEIIGRALAGRRDRVFLASKCGLVWDDQGRVRQDLSPGSLVREIDDSLRRLKTDHLDLWQIHWPSADYPLDDTLEAFARIRESGKVRHLGLSNFSAADLETAHAAVGIDSYQGLFNMFEQNAGRYHSIDLAYRAKEEILPIVRREGMAFLPYSPLMQGMLAGSIYSNTEFTDGDVRRENPRLNGKWRKRYVEIVDRLRPLAADRGISMAQLALVWTIHVPGIGSVIAGARSADHARKNAGAADLPGQEDLVRDIDEVLSAYRDLVE